MAGENLMKSGCALMLIPVLIFMVVILVLALASLAHG